MTLESIKAWAALPELFVAGMACLILVAALFLRPEHRSTFSFWAAVATLLAGALLVLAGAGEGKVIALNGMYVDDALGSVVKTFILLVTIGAFVYGRRYNRDRGLYRGEYYVLGLFGVTGMMIMASANSLLLLYLGLELLALCLYAMVAFHRDSRLAVEAAMKYFVLGALASAILLYGMSLLYGLTGGTLELPAISAAVGAMGSGNVALALAVVLVVVALAFKLGAVPFHMWVPDVYHGAPTSTTIYLGAAPKLAAFAIVMRLLVGGLEGQHAMWQQMLVILAILSVGLGNLVAIAQANIKRMLAYSTISHMGFFLFGILAGTERGYGASLFYVIVYTVMSLGAFGMVLLLSRAGFESERLEDFRGLARREPWYAFLMLILMFSMAGIPPTLGFFAKLGVIYALVDVGLVWVAVLAVLLAVIGAFYYLRVIKLMYFDEPKGETAALTAPADMRILLSVNALLVVAVVPWVGTLVDLCREAIARFAA